MCLSIFHTFYHIEIWDISRPPGLESVVRVCIYQNKKCPMVRDANNWTKNLTIQESLKVSNLNSISNK